MSFTSITGAEKVVIVDFTTLPVENVTGADAGWYVEEIFGVVFFFSSIIELVKGSNGDAASYTDA